MLHRYAETDAKAEVVAPLEEASMSLMVCRADAVLVPLLARCKCGRSLEAGG